VGPIERSRCGCSSGDAGLAMLESLKFLWTSTRGYRLRPWRSPFLRWRIETFSGEKADGLTLGPVLRFLWREKRQLVRFLRWTHEIKVYGVQGAPRRR